MASQKTLVECEVVTETEIMTRTNAFFYSQLALLGLQLSMWVITLFSLANWFGVNWFLFGVIWGSLTVFFLFLELYFGRTWVRMSSTLPGKGGIRRSNIGLPFLSVVQRSIQASWIMFSVELTVGTVFISTLKGFPDPSDHTIEIPMVLMLYIASFIATISLALSLAAQLKPLSNIQVIQTYI